MRLGGESSVRGGAVFIIHFPASFTWCTITTKETIERQIGRDKIFFFFFVRGKGFLESKKKNSIRPIHFGISNEKEK